MPKICFVLCTRWRRCQILTEAQRKLQTGRVLGQTAISGLLCSLAYACRVHARSLPRSHDVFCSATELCRELLCCSLAYFERFLQILNLVCSLFVHPTDSGPVQSWPTSKTDDSQYQPARRALPAPGAHADSSFGHEPRRIPSGHEESRPRKEELRKARLSVCENSSTKGWKISSQ